MKRTVIHGLLLFWATLLGQRCLGQAQYQFSGNCYSLTVSDILINGVSAETLRIEPGSSMQVHFKITYTNQPCFFAAPASIVFGYNGPDGIQYGECLYAASGFSSASNTGVSYMTFSMPAPSVSGVYYLNFANVTGFLDPGEGSFQYGQYLSETQGNGTIGVLQVDFSTPDDPWVSNGNFLYYPAGNVGIGTSTPSTTYRLSVNGGFHAKKIVVETGWADHVLAPGYALPTLDSVRAHIDAHGHLPGIPSEAEILAQGLDVGDVQRAMMAKIEELTLYLLEMQGENERLRSRMEVLESTQEGGSEK